MDELQAIIGEALSSVYRRQLAVFALTTALIATLILVLDMVQAKLRDTTSLLKVGYGAGTLPSVCMWGVGAALAAYLGGLLELFNVESVNARIIVGVSWPTVLPRLLALADEAAGKEPEPEQPAGGVTP
jgi:hypothetical protein